MPVRAVMFTWCVTSTTGRLRSAEAIHARSNRGLPTLPIRGLKKGIKRGQLDDGTDRQIMSCFQAAAPLAAVHRRARQSRCPKTRPDPRRLLPAFRRQVSLCGAIPQPEIRRIARTRRPGVAQHDKMIGFDGQFSKIRPRRPCCHGQTVQQKNEGQQLSTVEHDGNPFCCVIRNGLLHRRGKKLERFGRLELSRGVAEDDARVSVSFFVGLPAAKSMSARFTQNTLGLRADSKK